MSSGSGRGPGSHNAPFQWHLDAADIHLTELAMELCDGRPSHLERNIDDFVDRIGRYCPWGARLVDLQDLR